MAHVSVSPVVGHRLSKQGWLAVSLSLSLNPVCLGLAFLVVGICIPLKEGLSPSFGHSCLGAQRMLTFPPSPLMPGRTVPFPPSSGWLFKWLLLSGGCLMPHCKAKDSWGPVYYCFVEMKGMELSFSEFSRGAKNLQFYEKNLHVDLKVLMAT